MTQWPALYVNWYACGTIGFIGFFRFDYVILRNRWRCLKFASLFQFPNRQHEQWVENPDMEHCRVFLDTNLLMKIIFILPHEKAKSSFKKTKRKSQLCLIKSFAQSNRIDIVTKRVYYTDICLFSNQENKKSVQKIYSNETLKIRIVKSKHTNSKCN